MDVQVVDSAFVRATRQDIAAVLADVPAYGQWWPRARSTPTAADEVALELRPPGLWAPVSRLLLTIEQVRPGLGMRFRVGGWAVGEAEWYYLDESGGAIVHWLLRAGIADRGWRRALYRHRCAVRGGLQALKDRLEHGRRPGAEPEPSPPGPAVRSSRASADRRNNTGVPEHR